MTKKISRSRRVRIGAAAMVAGATLRLAGLPGSAVASQADAHGHDSLATRLASRISMAGLRHDLSMLQRDAVRNGGDRAPGTPGYDQSADYVIKKLTAAGFNVTTQEFPVRYSQAVAQNLTVGGKTYDVNFMLYTPNTPVGGITAPLAVLPAANNYGCAATDFASGVTGKIVLLQRGSCPFAVKQTNAAAAGAVGMLVYNNAPGWLRGSLGPTATANIPAGGISQADGQALSQANGAPVTLDLRTLDQMRTTRNIIAQTRTGRTDNVVVAGAHLDSVVEGPGINANGTGDAALLETAVKLGGSPKVANAVRFTFWGGWEFGEIGSNYYLSQLTPDQKADIAMYLNFDTLGSRNGGYFVYDGSKGPNGSAAITQAFQQYLAGRHLPTATVPLTYVYSDQVGFVVAGVPTGGLYTGQEEYKSPAQVALFGGQANAQMDPCFHVGCDTMANVNYPMFLRNAEALAYVTATYATSVNGANGITDKAQRTATQQH